ncbi:MAG: phosphotransferase [Sandaracinaceae bacterium]
MTSTSDIPSAVIEAWDLEGATFAPIATGWINRTFLVTRGDERLVLQRLHPVFAGTVNRDIDAITRHLEGTDVRTPRIVPTRTGALWIDVDRPWRMLTHVGGETLDTLGTPARARSAGALAGRFHRALADLEHTFAFTRPGAHDTPAHLAKLARVRGEHALEDRVAIDALADAILAYPLPRIGALPTRIIHGDLKATNLRFEGETAIAVLDLDTLAHGTIAVDVGDALRSWCNLRGEADGASHFDAVTFEAAMTGYAESTRGWLTREEAFAIVPTTETIALELASRFAADVYEDSYFGFDATRFPTRRAHNLARTEAQLALARSIRAQREGLEAIVRALGF